MLKPKQHNFADDELRIYDDAIVYKRGDYFQMRMWLHNEKRYARFSLRTVNVATAVDRAKVHYHQLMSQQLSGKTYFSKTTKTGVEDYLKQRAIDVQAGLIVKGRLSTIKTHLTHWLDFIGRDTKLKELERTDCENYFFTRTKTKKKIAVSQSTVENEQSTINALISWLYKRNETKIEGFDFKTLKRLDKGLNENRRDTFTDAEIVNITNAISDYITVAQAAINVEGNLVKALVGYYLGICILTGARRGELQQLRWSDIEQLDNNLVKITIRGETSKVRRTRQFVVHDTQQYFKRLKKLHPSKALIFSVTGKVPLTPRVISYHFDKLMLLAGVENFAERDLVPYSFRHYFITSKVNSNVPIINIAEMCGTSAAQIEKTYYHTTMLKMISNAMADYTVKDGVMVVD